jgi:hypothetical protein
MIAKALALRLPWVTMTPLGADVLPEVYCRKHRSSGRTSASTPAVGASRFEVLS